MRIAYIAVKGMPYGAGIEKVTEEIGARLALRGHKVLVYSSRDYGTADGIYKGMEIRTVPSINTKSLHKLSICFQAIRDVMLNDRADLVHVHAVGPSLFSFLPRLKGVPTVVQAHSLEWQRDRWGFLGKTFLKLANLSLFYFPNIATTVSKVQNRYYKEKYGKEVVYIPNGVGPVKKRDPDWLLSQGIKPNRYILFAARLVEEKGVHFLIKAFRTLKTEMQLVIAGDAAHAEKYKSVLRELAGDDPRIIFTGYVTGPPMEELFSNAYLFCLPSTLEGLSIALLEAMSYGNCCVASDIPENLEVIETHGFTFRNRDTEDLARLLGELIDQPGMVAEKGSAAREHARRNFSWDSVTNRLESLYLSLINEKVPTLSGRKLWTE
jgi:glycosyltransferase involved in cell wall biosynthesis